MTGMFKMSGDNGPSQLDDDDVALFRKRNNMAGKQAEIIVIALPAWRERCQNLVQDPVVSSQSLQNLLRDVMALCDHFQDRLVDQHPFIPRSLYHDFT